MIPDQLWLQNVRNLILKGPGLWSEETFRYFIESNINHALREMGVTKARD